MVATVVTENSERLQLLEPLELQNIPATAREQPNCPRASSYVVHQQNSTEQELHKGWCGESCAWVACNRLSVSEGDLSAIAVPYVTQRCSVFHITCLQSVISYGYVSHFMIIKLQIQKKMWIHKITPIRTCSSKIILTRSTDFFPTILRKYIAYISIH